MFHSASAIRRCFAQSVLLGRRSGSTSLAYRHVVAQRNIILSAILRETTGRHDPLDSAVSQSEGLRPTRRRYLNRTSLHISKIPSDTTDEEFRQAFSVLPGLVNSELVFNSGAARDYKGTANRGFGFLHFENEEAATAAARHLQMSPIRLQGYATEVNPSLTASKSPNEESHVLHISGLPLDIQFLEVMTLLKEKCPNFKSIRFMQGKPEHFLGVAAVVFEDDVAAKKAKESLHNATLGGMLLREHTISYGRPLYDQEPTNTLMILGTPTTPDTAYDFRRVLDELEGIERYKLIKDKMTNEFKGFTVVRCSNVDRAWKTLEWFNREYPQYRVTFITSSYEYEQKRKEQRRLSYESSGSSRSSRPDSDVD